MTLPQEIEFYASKEHPHAEALPSHPRGYQHRVVRARVHPDTVKARDERVQTIARWLAQHLTTTRVQAQGEAALSVVSLTGQRIEWAFNMLRSHERADQRLVTEAENLMRLHEREGVAYIETHGERLAFTGFARDCSRAESARRAASRANGQLGGRPKLDRETKTRSVSLYEDQLRRLEGVNLSELLRDLLDEHLAGK